MSRATAIVLFTDLVGSTELRGRLGEEGADELRRRHDQLLAQAVEANNGRVVKGLGDGIMATFGGAADAVAAGVAIQQGIDRLNRTGKAPVPLAVRVGLSAGDVSVEDDDVHGTPVIEASRLCAAALGGEILASEVVRWLGGAQGALSLTPAGSLELKGLATPVPTVRIEWDPAPVPTIPMPALLTDVGRIFVGRDDELERLGRLWKAAVTGEPGIALLAGEPGVGKTRLAAELAIRVHDEAGVVLAGRCDEDLGVPYQPFVEALRHFVDHTPSSELKERLGRYGGELARLVPELPERIPDLASPLQSDPETGRYRLFDGVAAWLTAASAEDPILLLLDDLQWAARPTLLLLRHIARSSDTKRLLILGTYRDIELAHDHPLIELVADLRRAGAVERLSVVGLDDVAVASIVEQAAGHPLDDDGVAFARAVHDETEGNPFFVREVLRHLAETKAIERRDDRWVALPIAQLGIPEGIRDVIGRRLARLSDDANQALRVAAVVGGEFEVSLLQAAGELSEADLFATLDEAIEARLVSEVTSSRFRFAHALVRATLYESLNGPRKAALHRRVAEAIEELHRGTLDDYLPALAHHWAAASAPTDTTRAVEYARRAGDRALAQLAHDEAATYYRQALDLLETSSSDLRLDLLISLGEALRRSGDPQHRATLLEAARLARERGETDGLVRAVLANSRGMLSSSVGQVDTDRVEALEAALAAMSGADSRARAQVLALLGLELTFAGDLPRRVALSDEALAIARRVGDPDALAHVLMSRYMTTWAPDNLAQRRSEAIELVALAERLGDPVILVRAWNLRYRTAFESADVQAAREALAIHDRLARELGQPSVYWLSPLYQAGFALLEGRFDDADRLATHALDTGEAAAQPEALGGFTIVQFQLRLEQGRLADIEETVRKAEARYGKAVPMFAVMLALLCCETGRAEEAVRIYEEAAPDVARLSAVYVWPLTMTYSAAVAAGLDRPEWAAVLYERLDPYPDLLPFSGGVSSGPVALYLGMLATTLRTFDDAETHFARAATLHERIGAPTWRARTNLAWGRMLLSRRQPGDAERAREMLAQAVITAREIGQTKVERDALALLHQGS